MAESEQPQMLAFSVEGKAAIVTGGGSGICLAFTELLLSHKCNVLIADLSLRPEAQAVVDAHQQASPRAVFHRTDVTDWTALQEMFRRATAEFGTVDIVCPGAGVFEEPWSNFWHPPGTAESRDPTAGFGHYATLDINLTHPIRLTQLAIAEFLQPSDGSPPASPANPKRVVHLSSIAGELPIYVAPIYGASKWASYGFVRSLAPLEKYQGIRINGVCPGIVKTPIWLEHPEKMKMLVEGTDVFVTPVEVADGMLRLITDPDLPGGSLVEVGAGSTRVVPLLGNMGPPKAAGFTSTARASAVDDIQATLAKPGWGKLH